jgi:hypothetical protein
MKTFKIKHTRTLIFSFVSKRQVCLIIIAPIIPFYSVELELHDRKV